MSAPVSSASRKRSTISTGMVRSASRNAMGAPRAAAMSARTAAAIVTLPKALALSALPRFVVVAVLVHRPNREVHSPHPVDLGDLDLHRVPDLDDVFHATDSVG